MLNVIFIKEMFWHMSRNIDMYNQEARVGASDQIFKDLK